MFTRTNKLRALALACALSLALTGGWSAFAQECIADLSGFRVGTEVPGSDGKVHITYNFANEDGSVGTPSAEMAAAISAAINQWNAHSGTTGVVFDPAPAGTVSDLQFKLSPEVNNPVRGLHPGRRAHPQLTPPGFRRRRPPARITPRA